VRMGINTGLNTVGSFGSDVWLNYTAIGAQVNIAMRLQQMAEPGEILLSHSTYSLVSDRVEAERLGETHLKGFHYSIQVFKFIRFVGEEPPMVLKWQGKGYSISVQPQIVDLPNREEILNLLEQNFGKCRKSGKPEGGEL
jgi:adenylate cyclase